MIPDSRYQNSYIKTAISKQLYQNLIVLPSWQDLFYILAKRSHMEKYVAPESNLTPIRNIYLYIPAIFRYMDIPYGILFFAFTICSLSLCCFLDV
jgi:hypothetical protein